MKAILLLSTSLVGALSLFIGGVAVSAHMLAEPAPHHFAHLDSPEFWTVQPVIIDPATQHYERLPAQTVAIDVAASDLPADAVLHAIPGRKTADGQADERVAAANDPMLGKTANAGENAAQADWCMARYRSYRVEDNSYQPFSGGPRRQCESPANSLTQTADTSADRSYSNGSLQGAQVEQISATPSDMVAARGQDLSSGMERVEASNAQPASRSHESWCMARYHSYRAGDDSYQPLDGGPRRACESPFG